MYVLRLNLTLLFCLLGVGTGSPTMSGISSTTEYHSGLPPDVGIGSELVGNDDVDMKIMEEETVGIQVLPVIDIELKLCQIIWGLRNCSTEYE